MALEPVKGIVDAGAERTAQAIEFLVSKGVDKILATNHVRERFQYLNLNAKQITVEALCDGLQFNS